MSQLGAFRSEAIRAYAPGMPGRVTRRSIRAAAIGLAVAVIVASTIPGASASSPPPSLNVRAVHKLAVMRTRHANLDLQFVFDGSLWLTKVPHGDPDLSRLVQLDGTTLQRIGADRVHAWDCVNTRAPGEGVFYMAGNCSQSNDFWVAPYDPLTKTFVWGDGIWMTDAQDVTEDSGVVYAFQEPTVYPTPVPATIAVDASDGSSLWTNTRFFGDIHEADGVVYVLDKARGTFDALDAADGHRLWHIPATGDINGFPAVVGGVAYVEKGFPRHEPTLVAVDVATHSIRWRSTGITGFVGVAGSDVIVDGPRGLEAISADTASVVWSEPQPSVVSLEGGVLWTTTAGVGRVTALDPATGSDLRSFPTNSDYPSILVGGDRLFIGDRHRVRAYG